MFRDVDGSREVPDRRDGPEGFGETGPDRAGGGQSD